VVGVTAAGIAHTGRRIVRGTWSCAEITMRLEMASVLARPPESSRPRWVSWRHSHRHPVALWRDGLQFALDSGRATSEIRRALWADGRAALVV
jgi:hypothetical protein